MPFQPVDTEVLVESLTLAGQGVCHHNKKVIFVNNALPGERVRIVLRRQSRHYSEADTVDVLTAAPERIQPVCPHSAICGGCSLQHADPAAQVRFREQAVREQLQHIGKVTPADWLPPITGPALGYRRKARLGVRHVRKKQKLLVGFREKHSNYLADISACSVLDPRVGKQLSTLAALLMQLESYDRIPQIEVAAGDERVALVFRHLQALPETDRVQLKTFGEKQHFDIWLQPGGQHSAHRIWPEEGNPLLQYALPDHALQMQFHPCDFTQVNQAINLQMIPLALALLAIQPTDHVLDLYCGLGNFTLPIARHAARVTGVEGCAHMTARARDNARANGIDNAVFHTANLTQPDAAAGWVQEPPDSILLDPPRTGAMEMLPVLAKLAPRRIVYVSCNPATLARDAGKLVHEYGFQLTSAGIIDMFPQTGHTETIALFEKLPGKPSHGHNSPKNSQTG